MASLTSEPIEIFPPLSSYRMMRRQRANARTSVTGSYSSKIVTLPIQCAKLYLTQGGALRGTQRIKNSSTLETFYYIAFASTEYIINEFTSNAQVVLTPDATPSSLKAANDREEVIAYCKRNGFSFDEVKTALDLVEKHFPTSKPVIDIECDPEGDGEWLVIRFEAHGPVYPVIESYDNLTTAWLSGETVKSASAIRFVYDIT